MTEHEELVHFIKHIAVYNAAPSIGRKYWETRNLDLAEIAKLVRADIKALVDCESLPDQKYSVKIERYGFNGSITITTARLRPERSEHSHVGRWADMRLTLERILEQYNYDASAVQYDYWCVRFYGSVVMEWEDPE